MGHIFLFLGIPGNFWQVPGVNLTLLSAGFLNISVNILELSSEMWLA